MKNKIKIFSILLISTALLIPKSLFAFADDLPDDTTIGFEREFDNDQVDNIVDIYTSSGKEYDNNVYSVQKNTSGVVASGMFCIDPQGALKTSTLYKSVDEDGEYDLSKCASATTTTDGSKASRYCGLAVILQEAYSDQSGASSDPNFYTKLDVAITLALRLWASKEHTSSEGTIGKHSTFNDAMYGGAITNLADAIDDAGGDMSKVDISKYLVDKKNATINGQDLLTFAASLYAKASTGTKLQQRDLTAESGLEKSVNKDGSYNFEVKSSFGSIDSITIGGQSIKYTQKTCSDGKGSCVDFSNIPAETINKMCKDKDDTVKIKVNYTSSDSLDKMKMYKAKNCPGCQFLIGFSANSQKTDKEIEIPCEDVIKEDHDPCLDNFTDPDTGKTGCTDSEGNFDESCEKYMDECVEGECVENYTNPKTGQVGCLDDKGKWDPTCENYKKNCEGAPCQENYTDPDTGKTGCTNSKGEFDENCDDYMAECEKGYCEEKTNPKTGKKVCYGQDGPTSCDTWKDECAGICEEPDPSAGRNGCTDLSGGDDPDCTKYMEECQKGYCEEKTNPKTGKKVCYGTNGVTSCDKWKDECKAPSCAPLYTDPVSGETGCTNLKGEFDINCEQYMDECVKATCGELLNPKTGEKKCYGKNGETSCDTWKDECEIKCSIDTDGNYYDSNGNLTTEKQWKEECTCSENDDGTYTGPFGGKVTKDEYEKQCLCTKTGDVCHGRDGEIIDCNDFPDICPKNPDEPDKCPSSFEDTTPQSSCQFGSTEGTLKDPEICSIMKNQDKNYYNDKMMAKVTVGGFEACSIYCREVLDFKFMDVETAQAGRYFNHDVTAFGSENLLSIQNLSTVIKATQQCGSEIHYNEWKAEFKQALDEVRRTWNELKQFEEWHRIGKTAESGLPYRNYEPGVRDPECDGCNNAHCDAVEYIYYWDRETANYWEMPQGGKTGQDRYLHNQGKSGTENHCGGWECSGEGENQICVCQATVCGIAGNPNYVISGTTAAANAYYNAVMKRDLLLKAIFECNFMKDDEMKQHYTFNKIRYFTNKYRGPKEVVTPYKTKTETNYYEAQSYFPDNRAADEFDYEENTTFKEQFPTSIEDTYETDPMGNDEALNRIERKWVVDDEYKWDNYCGGCGGDLSNGTGAIPFNETEELIWYNCDGSGETGRCQSVLIQDDIPTSAAASITLWRVTGHYQAQDFFTEIFTGDVKTSDSNDRIELPKSSWPVGRLRETNYQQGDPYDILVNFEHLGSKDRKPAVDFVNRGDGFKEQVCGYEVINEMEPYDCDDGYHICYNCDDPSTPEVEPCPGDDCPGDPSGDCPNGDAGFFFRSVDLSDLFPNSMYSPITGGVAAPVSTRPIGSNWNYLYEPSVLEKVKKIQEDLGNDIWSKATPQYVVVLSPSAMRKIDRFNNTIDYLDKDTLTCGKNLYCKSTFLESNLRNIVRSESGIDLYNKNSTANQYLYVPGGAI